MIPRELIEKDHWVRWKFVETNGKRTKVPIQVDGSAASTTDPKTWTSYEKIQHFNQIGFVFCEEDGFLAIDLDSVIISGILLDWADRIIRTADSYTERSPSQTGFHIIGKGPLPEWMPHRKDIGESGIEMYNSGRYFTMTRICFANHSQIREIDAEKVFSFLKPELATQKHKERIVTYSKKDLYEVDIFKIAPGLKVGVNQPHPFHNSTSGANFLLNADGSWRCWRDSQTGGPLKLYGIKIGVIHCGEEPDNEQWKEIFDAARAEGLIPDQATFKQNKLAQIPAGQIRRAL